MKNEKEHNRARGWLAVLPSTLLRDLTVAEKGIRQDAKNWIAELPAVQFVRS